MKPIVYFGNLMLSGTLTGSNESTSNPVREVADGSINLGYILTEDVSPTLHSGSATVEMGVARVPTTLVLPKCLLQSGMTLRLFGADDTAGTNQTNPVTQLFTAETRFFLAELPSGSAAKKVWTLSVSGVSGLVPAQTHEIQLASSRSEFDRPPQVGVTRVRVLQYTRIAVPGGQPFVKREGPRLRRTEFTFLLTSGAEIDEVHAFVDGVDGGGAFTLTDDLGQSYWAELLGNDVGETDEAGVFTWRPTFQEIAVE